MTRFYNTFVLTVVFLLSACQPAPAPVPVREYCGRDWRAAYHAQLARVEPVVEGSRVRP